MHINDQTVNDEAVVPFGGVRRVGHRRPLRRRGANLDAFTETRWITVRGDRPRRTRSELAASRIDREVTAEARVVTLRCRGPHVVLTTEE